MIYRDKPHSLLNFINKYQVKGYLVFKTAKDTFLSKIMPKGFGHVFAVIQHGGYSVLVDTTASHSMAHVYADGFEYIAEDSDTIIEFNRIIDTTERYYYPCLMSCVEVVKRFLGINKFSIQTPKQLYKELSHG